MAGLQVKPIIKEIMLIAAVVLVSVVSFCELDNVNNNIIYFKTSFSYIHKLGYKYKSL